jgi:hypothetical protein
VLEAFAGCTPESLPRGVDLEQERVAKSTFRDSVGDRLPMHVPLLSQSSIFIYGL